MWQGYTGEGFWLLICLCMDFSRSCVYCDCEIQERDRGHVFTADPVQLSEALKITHSVARHHFLSLLWDDTCPLTVAMGYCGIHACSWGAHFCTNKILPVGVIKLKCVACHHHSEVFYDDSGRDFFLVAWNRSR
jgi:hypothetical protein